MGEELFLVLPEKDRSRWPSYNRLLVEEINSNYFQYICSGISIISEFFDYEYNKRCLYDHRNVNAFKPFLDKNETTLLRKLLFENGWEDIRESAQNAMSSEYIIYGVKVDGYNVLTEAANRKKDFPTNSYVLLAKDIQILNHGKLTITVDGSDIELESIEMTINTLHTWLSNNRKPERNYNWNPKHGENGKGAHRDHQGYPVALLLSSKEHAKEILKYAIGVEGKKSLYVYDDPYEKVMQFMPEAENTYHSFHIEDNKIPAKIKEKLHSLVKDN